MSPEQQLPKTLALVLAPRVQLGPISIGVPAEARNLQERLLHALAGQVDRVVLAAAIAVRRRLDPVHFRSVVRRSQ